MLRRQVSLLPCPVSLSADDSYVTRMSRMSNYEGIRRVYVWVLSTLCSPVSLADGEKDGLFPFFSLPGWVNPCITRVSKEVYLSGCVYSLPGRYVASLCTMVGMPPCVPWCIYPPIPPWVHRPSHPRYRTADTEMP